MFRFRSAAFVAGCSHVTCRPFVYSIPISCVVRYQTTSTKIVLRFRFFGFRFAVRHQKTSPWDILYLDRPLVTGSSSFRQSPPFRQITSKQADLLLTSRSPSNRQPPSLTGSLLLWISPSSRCVEIDQQHATQLIVLKFETKRLFCPPNATDVVKGANQVVFSEKS